MSFRELLYLLKLVLLDISKNELFALPLESVVVRISYMLNTCVGVADLTVIEVEVIGLHIGKG